MKKPPKKIEKSNGGYSLTDKRVDKLILKRGIKNYEVFYSPIMVLGMFWSMIFAMFFPFILIFIYNHFSIQRDFIYIFIYLTITYFLIGIFNRSFAITDEEFLVINSHFPFWKIQSFKFEDITEVKISSDWKLKILFFLGIFHGNYVQLKTKKKEKRYYCLFLDVDCHDENWTDRTLDNLKGSLKLKGVNAKLDF